ncbi:erythromycin esterase family protein [Dysgonomonas termitidis]
MYKIIVIISFILLPFCLFSQSIEDVYDLKFESFGKSYRGDWMNQGSMVKVTIDSNEVVNGRHPIKIYSKNTWSKNMPDREKILLLSRTVILPEHVNGSYCKVSINSKSENLINWKFGIKGLDVNENILHSDSLYIESEDWQEHSLSFPLNDIKAVKIEISIIDDDPSDDQNAWLDRVYIDINNQNINACRVDKPGSNADPSLNKEYLIPLSLADTTIARRIPGIEDKKIIGIGECTHGSQEIKHVCFQLMKSLVVQSNCNVILIERPADMSLKWDLYTQGVLAEAIEPEIIQELKCMFDDYESFFNFLQWLRKHNETSEAKVRIFGFDTLADPQTTLYEYFKLLIGDANSLCYLQKLNENDYESIRKYALNDSTLQSSLSSKDFDYLLFLINEAEHNPSKLWGRDDKREYGMWRKTDEIIKIYLKENDKAVVYAHSSHTNKMKDFFSDIFTIPSLGAYIYRKYKDEYFSIAIQVGKGEYTQDDTGAFSKAVLDQLQYPVIESFEYRALKMGNDYFYYPTNKLDNNISSIRVIGRERRGLNQFFFCSLNKRFDGLIFVSKSSKLNNIEEYPFFYTTGLFGLKRAKRKEILKNELLK